MAGSRRPRLTADVLLVLVLVLVPIRPLGRLGFVSRALPEWREHRASDPAGTKSTNHVTAGQIDVYDHGERQNQILSNVTDVQEGWLVVSGRQSAVSAQWSVAGSGRPQLTTNILFVLLLLLVLVPILPLGGLGFVSRALPEWREHRWAVPPCPNLKKGGGLSSGRAAHARRIVDQKKIDCGACTCDILVSLHRSIIIYRGEGRTLGVRRALFDCSRRTRETTNDFLGRFFNFRF